MLKHRIVPVLTFNGFALVKTKQFDSPRMIGNPVQAARVFDARGVDELIFLDIYASRDGRRVDRSLLSDIISECYMPVTIGGSVRSIDDVTSYLEIGADKVVIGKAAFDDPSFVREASRVFGAQCICISMDCSGSGEGDYIVHAPGGTRIPAVDFARRMEDSGAGELYVNSIDRDGMMTGFDVGLVSTIRAATGLPLIAGGGAGEPAHFVELFEHCRIEAAAAASIFFFTRYTPDDVKAALAAAGVPVRLLRK